MAQIEGPSEVWGTNHNFLPTTFFYSSSAAVPELLCCAVLCCTQDAGDQVCSRNHQIYKGNPIPFRDNICFFNMQLPLHLSAIHECRWFLEEEIVDMPVYRCGICKTFVLMFIIIWSLWNFKTLCSFFFIFDYFQSVYSQNRKPRFLSESNQNIPSFGIIM